MSNKIWKGREQKLNWRHLTDSELDVTVGKPVRKLLKLIKQSKNKTGVVTSIDTDKKIITIEAHYKK